MAMYISMSIPDYGDLDYMHEYGWSDHGLACNWFKRYSGLCIKVAVGSSFLS
jgi:hypothetical protein